MRDKTGVVGDVFTAAPARVCVVDDEDNGFSVHSSSLASSTTTGFSGCTVSVTWTLSGLEITALTVATEGVLTLLGEENSKERRSDDVTAVEGVAWEDPFDDVGEDP